MFGFVGFTLFILASISVCYMPNRWAVLLCAVFILTTSVLSWTWEHAFKLLIIVSAAGCVVFLGSNALLVLKYKRKSV